MKITNKVYGYFYRGFGKLLILCLLLVGLSAHTEIYKWSDEQGRVHFSDKAPETGLAEPVGDQLIINSYPGVEVSGADFLEQRDAQRRAKADRNKPSVVMYSAVWCGVCKRARQYFKANNIPFNEYDVETSSKGKSDFSRMKGRGVPIILVGKKRMNGFDAARFKKLYGG